MKSCLRGALYATASLAVFTNPAIAEHLHIYVPVGQYGTLTAPSVWQAQQQLRTVPGGVSVVPAREFQGGYAVSMKDMLASAPGVYAQQRYAEESRLSIRGSGLSRGFHLRGIVLLQDGVPLNFADGSGDFQEIDPLILQHLEVYRGGQALRYGAATLGGAVNMVTPSARTAGHDVMLRIEGGSYDTIRTHAQAAGFFKGGDIFAAATRSLSDGYRAQSEQNNMRFSGNMGLSPGPDAETRFYVSWNDIEQEVPGTISYRDALDNPRTVPAVNILNDYARDIRSLRLANRTVVRREEATLEFGGYANDKSLYHPIFQVVDQDSLDTGLFTRYQTPWRIGDYLNDLTVGVNLGRGVNDADRFTNVGGARGVQTVDSRQLATNAEFYAENHLHLDADWRLIAGFQARFSHRRYTDDRTPANNAEKSYNSFNPKLGLLWKFKTDSEVYASVTHATETPTFSELVQGAVVGFVPVDQQKSWTAEIGTRGAQGAWSWDVTAYRAWLRNEMLQFAVGPDIPASTFNADKTIHQGLEMGAGWQARPDLTFKVTYNLNDFYFKGDDQYGDNELAGAPPHQVRLSVRYETEKYFIEPAVEWLPGAAWVDYANTMKSNSYAVFGVTAGWDVTDDITVFADGRNLTDEPYVSSFSTVTDARTANIDVFYPGEGRSMFGGIKVRF